MLTDVEVGKVYRLKEDCDTVYHYFKPLQEVTVTELVSLAGKLNERCAICKSKNQFDIPQVIRCVDLEEIPLKTFKIYSEGYRATGECGYAQLMGSAEATTFEEACQKHFGNDTNYNPERNTYWGCALFDNLADAQKSFG